MNNNYGSEWKKWDLHVHTKNTAKNDQFTSQDFDSFCRIFLKKALEHNVASIGITDYFSIENYKKVKRYVQQIRTTNDFTDEEMNKIEQIFILPNVELRMLPVTDCERLVNIHCIFNPLYEKDLENDFFNNIECKIVKNYKMNKQGIIDLGKSLNDRLLTVDEQYKKGVDNFVVSHESIKELINENTRFRENTIIVVSNSNNDGASGFQKHYDLFEEPSSLDAIRKSIYCLSDAIFSGNKEDRKYFLGGKTDSKEVVKNKCGSLKPCIHGSDAHTEEKLFSPDQNKFCWIKAELTFEGLKQIIYEPEDRVYIGEKCPIHSPNVIESFKINLPKNAIVGDNDFCLAGENKDFYLSPYFNCFIGGRGTGKSTILNFFGLYSNGPNSSIDFWNLLKPKNFEPKDNNVFRATGTEFFEFLGQNEVETFATDKVKFTKAIYDRANKYSENRLKEIEADIEKYKNNMEQKIKSIIELKKDELDKQKMEKEIRSLEVGKKITSDKEYIVLADQISIKTKELQSLKEWKRKISELKDSLNDILAKNNNEKDYPLNKLSETIENNRFIQDYRNIYNQSLQEINRLIISLDENKFKDAINEEELLQRNIDENKNGINDILQKENMSAENILQMKSAPQQISLLNDKLIKLEEQIKLNSNLIKDDYVLNNLRLAKQNYEEELKKLLQPLQITLENQNTQVYNIHNNDLKLISLNYFFDQDTAWEELSKEFYSHFKIEYKFGERESDVISYILKNKDVFNKEYQDICSFLDECDMSKKYNFFLSNVFKDENNFLIYRAIKDKHLYDVNNFKRIQVKYDKKDIEKASFGQKCTAVIVILILFGNFPLIIDEPEAHLDSSLIANYLVPLLKRRKADRQIIFATHNANFVINGDAEKIFVLEVPDKNTEFTETTIENLNHRRSLLKLEGGIEAFDLRMKKLKIDT